MNMEWGPSCFINAMSKVGPWSLHQNFDINCLNKLNTWEYDTNKISSWGCPYFDMCRQHMIYTVCIPLLFIAQLFSYTQILLRVH